MKALEGETEERLLIEAVQCDPSRFAELYENNFDQVYAFIAHRVRNREEAQDLTGEVFHQALAGIGRFQWRGIPFRSWLLGIAAHLLADRWQQAGKLREVPSDESEEPGVEDKIELRALLSQLVEGLPEDQRLVVIRRFIDQRSLREIAQELGRSEGAIKQLQLRALQNLRTRIRSNHV